MGYSSRRVRLLARIALAAFAVFAAGNWLSVSGQTDPRLLPLHIEMGRKAPDFSLPSANRKTVKLSEYAGHIVLIDFYRGYW